MKTQLSSHHEDKDLSTLNFLVTGGAGFIGSHLVEYLLKYSAGKVRVLDNFSTGFRKNLDSFWQYPNFELLEGDIRDLATCRDAVKDINIVFHEAALGSVPRSVNDPLMSNEVNVSGFINMLVAGRDEGVMRIIYAASSSTYGDSTELPKSEDRIGKPLSPYAVTKYVNELYADVFSKTYKMELIGLRYFNVFGPRQNPEGAYSAVIPRFIKMLMKGTKPVIHGDGNYSRDFTYIDNVLQMNIKAALTDSSAAINEVYNVAYGQQTTLNELVAEIKATLSKLDPQIADIFPEYGPERAGDIPHSLAAIEKAQRLLHYRPLFSFETGLRETVDWFIKEGEAERTTPLVEL
ncbi:SDR family oxidoreductase [Arcticibacter sp.]|jgi:UDP-N-acetylglucosamine 4-epimerase|uniref:SDR family oxidoreductase n=1 Tax=Arcticibacter sp. TaxID=1872630 RepID=UPI00388E4736